MKRILSQLFNVFMACTILVSSTGFGLVERSCHMRGKTVYLSLKEAEAKRCAADQLLMTQPAGQTGMDKTPCCADETRYENVDVTSSLTQLVAKFLKTAIDTVTAGFTATLIWFIKTVFPSKSSASLTAHAPPLPAGRTLLAFVQRLLI